MCSRSPLLDLMLQFSTRFLMPICNFFDLPSWAKARAAKQTIKKPTKFILFISFHRQNFDDISKPDWSGSGVDGDGNGADVALPMGVVLDFKFARKFIFIYPIKLFISNSIIIIAYCFTLQKRKIAFLIKAVFSNSIQIQKQNHRLIKH